MTEAATNYCTHNLANRLGELSDVRLQAHRHPLVGLRKDDLYNSWPMIARSMGI